MMRNIPTYLLIAFFALLTGCLGIGTKSYDDAMDKNRDKLSDNMVDDAEFLVEMKSFGMMLNALSDSAASRAYARKVADFGREISGKMAYYLEDLEKVADDKDIALPDEMSNAHRRELNDLLDADEDEFDEVYLTTLEAQLQKQLRHTERMATEAHDDDVRAWTARQIKMMKDYKEKADKMEEELLTD